MRERRRKHDDAHRPFGGNGKRAMKPAIGAPSQLKPVASHAGYCEICGASFGDYIACEAPDCGFKFGQPAPADTPTPLPEERR